MKIGIDAKWLFRGPPSGQRAVRQIVDGLAETARDHELHLFLDANSQGNEAPLPVPEAHCHHVWAGNNQLSNLFAIPRLANRLRLDAVVYQNFVPRAAWARHARIAYVHDVIFDSHPEFFTRLERVYFSTLRRQTASADRVCTGSTSERDRLVRLRYAEAGRVDVVPHAIAGTFVPLGRLDPAETERTLNTLGVTPPFVLFVSRLNPRKNVTGLVEAMARVQTAGLSLVIAGTGDSGPGVRAADSAGVADRVRWVGSVTDSQLAALYAVATMFCFPSFDEGFGLPPLEAMAAGTPVIVSRIPALAETCGDAAVYVDPHDRASIAAAIDAVATDDARRAELRDAGLRQAALFTVARSAQALLASVQAAVWNRA